MKSPPRASASGRVPESGFSPARIPWAALVLLTGCATGSPPGDLTSEWGPRSRPFAFHANLGSRRLAMSHALPEATGGAAGFPLRPGDAPRDASPREVLACGGVDVPSGWPDLSAGDAKALLAPFLTCTSPAEYVALQQRVDMPRLVEALDDWSAVRLGALGPMREDAAEALHRKRVCLPSHRHRALRPRLLRGTRPLRLALGP